MVIIRGTCQITIRDDDYSVSKFIDITVRACWVCIYEAQKTMGF